MICGSSGSVRMVLRVEANYISWVFSCLFLGQQVRTLYFIYPSQGRFVVLISWMDLVIVLAVQKPITPNYNETRFVLDCNFIWFDCFHEPDMWLPRDWQSWLRWENLPSQKQREVTSLEKNSLRAFPLVVLEMLHLPHSEELPHLLPPWAHQLLVLSDAEFFSIDNAGPLRPGFILVIWVLL